jgi:hypothetical protein
MMGFDIYEDFIIYSIQNTLVLMNLKKFDLIDTQRDYDIYFLQKLDYIYRKECQMRKVVYFEIL